MHGLVLAGGEGSRLRAGGVPIPKPLVEVAGRPQVIGLLRVLEEVGCSDLTCMVRADFPEVVEVLRGERFRAPLTVRTCRTPTSLHTLVAGLGAVPSGPVLCSMVDTVMHPEDWQAAFQAVDADLGGGVEVVLVVTPDVDDEAPLYVGRHPNGAVTAVSDDPIQPVCVTGGVYGFSTMARRAAAEALGQGHQRMRGFLKARVARGGRMTAVEIAHIIDLDRPSDLERANAWLAPQGPGSHGVDDR